MKIKMFCPCCRHKLKQGDDLRIQTLSEHVSNPNGEPCLKPIFYCYNKKCKAFHPYFSKKILLEKLELEENIKLDEYSNIFWDEYGDMYGIEREDKKIKFIDNNNSPFGSISRRLHIEIYKKDENFILLNFIFVKLVVIFKYKADENGNILKRKFKIETWVKNYEIDSYTLYSNPIRMFFYSLNCFRKKYKYFLESPDSRFAQNELVSEFMELPTWENRLYRIFFKKYINFFYYKTRQRLILFNQEKQ